MKILVLSKGFKIKSSILSFNATSCFKVTSSLLINALSLLSNSVCRLLGCLMVSAFSKSLSNEPNLLINSAAVFIPIPGTPGILSTESPANDCTSITFSGGTPNFSLT